MEEEFMIEKEFPDDENKRNKNKDYDVEKDAEFDAIESVFRLSKDLRKAAEKLGDREIRYLVDSYYAIQKYRKGVREQIRSMEKAEEPIEILSYIFKQSAILENQIKAALDRWTNARKIGRWCRSHKGVGPIITAGLLAHIDIRKAPTLGHILRFGGLDPTLVWNSSAKAKEYVKEVIGAKKDITRDDVIKLSEVSSVSKKRLLREGWDEEKKKFTKKLLEDSVCKRPYNADLKQLWWKMADCFVKFHKKEDCFYGKLYAERKELEIKNNESGKYAGIAKETLETKNIKDPDTRKAYESGKLPDGRIDLRARRYAAKIFLSHLHHAMYLDTFKKEPPVPFAFTKSGGDHAHYIEPPNLDIVK